MKISELQLTDRPREKAMASGVESLSDAELIGVLLGSGVEGQNAVELAREMLQHCGGSLSVLARMSRGEMKREFKGVGDARAVTLKAAIALGRRVARSESADSEAAVFNSDEVVFNHMLPMLGGLDHEEFHVLMLSRSGKLKSQVCVSRGGTSATVVDVKLVVRHALDRLADSVILVHNHPSGTLAPSPQDDELTHRIVEACRLFNIAVRDHVIVTSAGRYSYFVNGRL